jgi:hypothetical protein
MAQRRPLAVLVEHRNPEKVQLKKHQQVRGESVANFGSPVTGHGALFYREMGKEGVKN